MYGLHKSAFLVGVCVVSALGCGSSKDDLGLGCLFDGGIADANTDLDAGMLPDAPEPVSDGGCSGSDCPCVPNTKTCRDEDPGAEFVCEQGANGPSFVRHACESMSICTAGACQPCSSSLGACKLGERKCSPDTQSVMQCNCLGWQTALECKNVGMTTCIVPTPPAPPLSPKDPLSAYCVNECGGRNVPLDNKLCDADPNATCGYLVCEPSTFELVPDHTACLPAASPCTKGTDCKSCSCIGGICIGNTEKSCAAICQ